MAPVGHASRHPARAQCLQTSDIISQRSDCSTKATCRHVDAPSAAVLSYDIPVKAKPSSGNWFHCLHATSHALHPMQMVVSVKKPLRWPLSDISLLRLVRFDAVLGLVFAARRRKVAIVDRKSVV